MQISANNNFQIEFAIERGKTWSNVVKYLIGDSYFKEEVKESSLIAAVRGTIFEVNLDKGYIHTVDHAIEIQNTHDRSSFSLPEGTAVNMLQNLEKISLEMLDKAWIDFNNREDVMYTKELSRQFYEKLSSADIGARFWDYLMTRFFGKNVFMDNLENRILELESLAPVDDQKASVFSRAIDVYELLYFMPLSDRVLDFKTRLRRIILTTAPEESRRGFEDDFSRHLLYEYWESLRAGMVMQILSIQSSLAELSKMGVNLEKLKAIDN
jgi:hypothetical protein